MENIKPELLQVLILTKNEEPNISRVLDKLQWLEKVLILDSHSTDNTIAIVESYPNVEVAYRNFDSFARQCNYGLSVMNSEWVLSLDADYVLTDGFIEETKEILSANDPDISAVFARFEFLIHGRELRGNNTTPRAVLFRRSRCSYFDDGHAHRLQINGETAEYKSKILHDDRKSLSRWLSNQDSYSRKECDKLLDISDPASMSVINKIRRTKVFSPILVFFYCLFVKGLFLNGWAGWYYTMQRTMVEMLFALRLIEEEELK